jgi:hypothetical protein
MSDSLDRLRDATILQSSRLDPTDIRKVGDDLSRFRSTYGDKNVDLFERRYDPRVKEYKTYPVNRDDLDKESNTTYTIVRPRSTLNQENSNPYTPEELLHDNHHDTTTRIGESFLTKGGPQIPAKPTYYNNTTKATARVSQRVADAHASLGPPNALPVTDTTTAPMAGNPFEGAFKKLSFDGSVRGDGWGVSFDKSASTGEDPYMKFDQKPVRYKEADKQKPSHYKEPNDPIYVASKYPCLNCKTEDGNIACIECWNKTKDIRCFCSDECLDKNWKNGKTGHTCVEKKKL